MKTRAGFTLIELMVAIALTLFIMVILSQAFVMSLDTFSSMKGIGDMQVNLRTAEVLLREDLSQDHFTGKRRLSDPNIVSERPTDGFFVVRRSSAASNLATANYLYEGTDSAGLPSYRAVDHLLYMTNKRKGNRLESFYNAPISGNVNAVNTFFGQPTAHNVAAGDLPGYTWAPPYQINSGTGIYASQWSEVLYYLVPTGTTEAPTDPNSPIGTRTFGLYRAQFVMVPDSTNVNGKIANGNLAAFGFLSCNPTGGGNLQFYSPADAATPSGLRVIPDMTAFNPDPTATPLGARVFGGATLVCPNVISFQLQVMQLGSGTFDDAAPPAAPFIYDSTRFGVGGYTTNGLKGIQVTLRVWDFKTRQARQVTVAQDL